MRIMLVLLLSIALSAALSAVEEVGFKDYSVVFYHEYVVVDGIPVETSKSLILSQVTQTAIGGEPFLVGVVPEGVGSDFAGSQIHIRNSLVYLVLGTDSTRAAKVLNSAASTGVWRKVE